MIRYPRKYKKLSAKELKKIEKAKTKKKKKGKKDIEEEKIEDDENDGSAMHPIDPDSDTNIGGELLDPDEIDLTNPDHYNEFVLDLIVERKTSNDLASSIRDGRYDEQKFRLRNSGINNVIYLIEGKAKQN